MPTGAPSCCIVALLLFTSSFLAYKKGDAERIPRRILKTISISILIIVPIHNLLRIFFKFFEGENLIT
ncbi:MAG: hypothetical protein A3I75_00810 [Deltaproteobacteria bacterium RIFCSPLOWO2_02_FULL_50_16]|nr:MAG: hypothetical protein A2053_04590 [Deltaproteobacteria bacterium GWA2_50_8]OGQ30510.1 MAG: hypothetical protein A3B79_02520 [Deltaproteobacteria bacterium RIFCSPHIGHO2_02_FULL_50_15]OGQ56368.1 MAG: hypothetical protein A3I75_00810 [Deltaproteobacteria bacterium RIFCSPLOWO2_02_FULL_50_16]OGQ67771.1 MAG: hypothetical protein A3F89_02055 [Deltaproteobacteria bacterium RIFCSPLOWO2_12_FULL_50_11]